MASGLPAVSTAFAGVKEVIDDGSQECGITVDLDRDDQMAMQIVELLASPARRQSLGHMARESVYRRFSWPHLLAKMELLYDEVANAVKQ
jgi:glycosyltransferase involved in cell wall biosynthesis